MKPKINFSLVVMSLVFLMHQGESRNVTGVKRKESILKIDSTDLSNIKIEYDIKNHLGQENINP